MSAQLFGRAGVMDGAESDEALVVRCRGGDAGAFRTLIERYERPLYNAAYRVLGNADDARDVAQAAFVELAERFDAYDPSHRFFSWIYRIAVNRALNLVRAKGREQALRDLPRAPSSGDPE